MGEGWNVGGLLDSVGSGLGGLFSNTIGRIVDGIAGAAGQVGALVPADPRVLVIGAIVVLALLAWAWLR